jgi:BirA family biotin operon repressor/biotin-[acetyl-CoA-carboxylase] ligase
MASTRTAVPILAFDELDSTNSEARRRAEAGEAGPFWITALRQTAGRGRRGRNWETGQGNLAATLLMLTDREPREAAQVSFIAALAVSDLARAYLPANRVKVKWPNDVMVDNRKLAGVLVESGQWSGGGLWLAIGAGINLLKAPEHAERPAITLSAATMTPPPEPRVALEGLAAAFADWLEIWDQEGFAAIAGAWTERAQGIGQVCSVRLPAETIEGIAEGLETDGALRLRLADGSIRRITAGDVFFGSA